MRHLVRGLFFIAITGLLAACGGGGGGGGFSQPDPTPDPGTPGGPTGPTVASLQLLASSTQIPSAGTTMITLTALVRDNRNVVMAGVDVDFAADNDGTIQVIRGTTDETGTAQATLSTVGNKTNRDINVIAAVDSITDTTIIQVTGTTIPIAGPTAIVSGDTATLTITLQDSAGDGIPGQTLGITSAQGNTISNRSPVTDASGQAVVQVTGVMGGVDIISVTGGGATGSHQISVSTDQFVFLTPPQTPVTEVPLGVTGTATVRWLSSGVPVVGQPVNFSATRGTLSDFTVITDANGQASVDIVSDNAGPSVITAAAANGGPSTQVQILFVATQAASLTLQATPAVIGPNVGGAVAETSTLNAVVRDPNNNLVKNKRVLFNLTDVTGGNISPADAITDTFGRASTVYTPGPAASGLDGVQVDAVVSDTPAVNQTVFLTVARKELFLALGTGNDIVEPDPTIYDLPYAVLVTDAAGAPVENAEVTLSIVPTHYIKGFYIDTDPDPNRYRWVANPTAECRNEDVNVNGLLDPGEDNNNNGVLEPGNVATLSQPTVTTDETGFAIFNVTYAQEFGSWVDVELTARARVEGSEATEFAFFRLPISAADASSPSPPGGVESRWGVTSICAIPEEPPLPNQ